LDGETDWKMRKAVNVTQTIDKFESIISMDAKIVANPPSDKIYEFEGYF